MLSAPFFEVDKWTAGWAEFHDVKRVEMWVRLCWTGKMFDDWREGKNGTRCWLSRQNGQRTNSVMYYRKR